MFFRFGSALVLVVLISLAGTALEKRNLKLRRAVSWQHYRLEVLLEQHAAHRVQAQQLGAPLRLVESLPQSVPQAAPSSKPATSVRPAKAQRNKPKAE